MPDPGPPAGERLPGTAPTPLAGADPHVFDEIIETFRAMAGGASVAEPNETTATTELTEPAELTEPTEPATVAAPLARPEPEPPHRRWRTPLRHVLVAVVLAALMLGVAGYLADRLPQEPAAQAPPTEAAPAADPHREYAGVLAEVAAATDLASLRAAAERADRTAATLAAQAGTADPVLAAEVASLQSLSALDAVTADNAVRQFPATAATVRSAAAGVTQALRTAGVADPARDPRPAVATVVRVVAPLALAGLGRRLEGLLAEAGRATLTADLRNVAGRAATSRVTTEDTVGVLGDHPRLLARARGLHGSFTGLAALAPIDADHLDVWTPVRLSLTTDLAAAGLPTDAVGRIDAVVQTARQKLVAWAAAREVAGGTTRAEVAAYAGRIRRVLTRVDAAAAGLPPLVVTDVGSFDLTNRVHAAAEAVKRAVAGARKVRPVPELEAAHTALLGVLDRVRSAAVSGHAAALAAEICGACVLGDQAAWARYSADRNAVGDLSIARGSWDGAVERALDEALAKALPPPPRPEV